MHFYKMQIINVKIVEMHAIKYLVIEKMLTS